MQSIINTAILVLLWVANLFNSTGLDAVYHITDWAQRITILLFIASIMRKVYAEHQLPIENHDFYAFGGMTIIFSISSWIHGAGLSAGMDYLWVFCLIYLLAHMEIDDKTMLWTGLAYGVMGFAILYIFDYGTTLKGWNTNSIAMIGMHSFLILMVPFFKTQQLRSKLILIATAALFSFWVSPTNSRSGILFGFLAVLFAIGIIPRGLITKSRGLTLLWLLAPLAIAIVVVQISKGGYMTALNQWSIRNFRKPLFSGRDTLWASGLEEAWSGSLIGSGKLASNSYYHNNAVICLVSFGIAGFSFWVASFFNILNRTREYLDDYIVTGCFVGFIMLYVQQSVELGFISSNPTLLGYVLLGMMLGRVNYLRKEELYYDTEN